MRLIAIRTVSGPNDGMSFPTLGQLPERFEFSIGGAIKPRIFFRLIELHHKRVIARGAIGRIHQVIDEVSLSAVFQETYLVRKPES